VPTVTESADTTTTAPTSGEVLAEYSLADIVSITETAEKHGAVHALHLVRNAAEGLWRDSRPDFADAVEVAVKQIAKAMDAEHEFAWSSR